MSLSSSKHFTDRPSESVGKQAAAFAPLLERTELHQSDGRGELGLARVKKFY
jgi:hypothetical protein